MAEERGEPKYKVGDIVTIKSKREGKEIDYLFSFTDRMVRDYGGTSHRITNVMYYGSSDPHKFSDDGYRYRLEDGDGFNWSSSMFEEASKASPSWLTDSPDDSDINAFIRRKKCPKLDFNL